ncbi:hypothetical protein BB14905_12630 [Bacillus sp. B14905]|nr:hypothetical protein BB14905_12630 [Bacillus sp. B14905]
MFSFLPNLVIRLTKLFENIFVPVLYSVSRKKTKIKKATQNEWLNHKFIINFTYDKFVKNLD